MAKRPIFVPVPEGSPLVDEIPIEFTWHPGFAVSQKKKNVAALHEAAALKGFGPLLEVSSKSERELGQSLSAFILRLEVEGRETSVESAFQGSKVFEQGGPFKDLLFAGSREAKRDPRLRASGRLIGFRFEEQDLPLTPDTAFYDWLYVSALLRQPGNIAQLEGYAGFTDIEFNPKRSLNCQARTCALIVSLQKRALLPAGPLSFESFRKLMLAAAT